MIPTGPTCQGLVSVTPSIPVGMPVSKLRNIYVDIYQKFIKIKSKLNIKEVFRGRVKIPTDGEQVSCKSVTRILRLNQCDSGTDSIVWMGEKRVDLMNIIRFFSDITARKVTAF